MTCLADPVATTEKPVQECCACGTAKYRVTFYGNWSEKAHPKDYPSKMKAYYYSIMHGFKPLIHEQCALEKEIV